MFDTQAFKSLVQEAVTEALNEQRQDQYEGFADMVKFREISGISRHDIEEKLMPLPQFRQHVYRLSGQKRYVDVKPALEVVREVMEGVD